MDKAKTKSLNRRAMISGMAGASIAATATTKAGGSEQDPHPQWLLDWRRLQKEWEAADDTGNWDSPKCLALHDCFSDIEQLLCLTKATTIEGVTAQFEYLNEDIGYYLEGCASTAHDGILNVIQSGLNELVKGAKS